MDRKKLLELLFEHDESLLQTDTHLNKSCLIEPSVPEAVDPRVPNTQGEEKAISSEQIVEDVSLSDLLSNGKDEVDKGLHDDPSDGKATGETFVDQSPVDWKPTVQVESELVSFVSHNSLNAIETRHASPGQPFCPLMAVARFPYKYIQGGLSQTVASRFFDRGKIWERSWDLYYIHVPSHMGSRPLLLLSTAQVEKLIQEINDTLDCTLSLPTESHLGFVLTFDERAPQPRFKGQFSSRNMKEYLESTIPLDDYVDYDPMDPLFVEFEKKIEAGLAASKNKKKAFKAKKQQTRIQNQCDLVRCLRRTQCYFGLRSRSTCHEVCSEVNGEAPWTERQIEEQDYGVAVDPVLPPLESNEPAPYSFWNEPVFVSVDVESNERCHSQVTEVGISTLDTLDLIGIPPGDGGGNWTSRIQSRHLRVREYAHVVNKDFVSGCPDKFEFGKSEWISMENMVTTVDGFFQSPYSHQVNDPTASNGQHNPVNTTDEIPPHKKLSRNIVFVGHNNRADMAYLRDLGVAAFDKASNGPFLDALDTAELFRTLQGEDNPRSLGGILGEFGITGWHLHNAGNDARYTMEALVQIALHSLAGSHRVKGAEENGKCAD